MNEIKKYTPKNHVRIVTAASLFDGHDVSINIIRRILQNTGVEVIHLGHNRSVREIVYCAIQEDAQAIAVTSYQGGHIEFLKFMYDLLKENNSEHIKIFAGGGGVILPDEIDLLQKYGICRIFSPDDGRKMGLQGMINEVIKKSDFLMEKVEDINIENIKKLNFRIIARCITLSENNPDKIAPLLNKIKRKAHKKKIPVIGITGTGGSGKSSIVDELARRYLSDFTDKTLAIISVDPSKRKTGGALLGDRIRMNSVNNSRVYMRSIALRKSTLPISNYIQNAIDITKYAGFDCIIIETPGIGQSDTQIVDLCDISVYVMTPEYGAATQLEKIDMLDFADIIVLNKFDKRGAQDALKDIAQQYSRNHKTFNKKHDQLPIFGTCASQFNDQGINRFYMQLLRTLSEKGIPNFNSTRSEADIYIGNITIIPPQRTRYLSEISEAIRNYNEWTENQAEIAQKLFSLHQSLELITSSNDADSNVIRVLEEKKSELETKLDKNNKAVIQNWQAKKQSYKNKYYTFCVRDREIKIETQNESLSHLNIPKISLPRYRGWGDILKWNLRENVPGEFPFASGVFPFKRESEDPTRMFAGEGGPERTNKRFHYLSFGMPAKRLSTAFDSVTLYGEDPTDRPDIYGKIGNSGVSISCLDDVKKLYSGFNLMDPKTSVSLTINGPAPI
ncbi:MAG: methylmalonyl-CoA mutase family protein, partial [Chitinispirillia bacterium]